MILVTVNRSIDYLKESLSLSQSWIWIWSCPLGRHIPVKLDYVSGVDIWIRKFSFKWTGFNVYQVEETSKALKMNVDFEHWSCPLSGLIPMFDPVKEPVQFCGAGPSVGLVELSHEILCNCPLSGLIPKFDPVKEPVQFCGAGPSVGLVELSHEILCSCPLSGLIPMFDPVKEPVSFMVQAPL